MDAALERELGEQRAALVMPLLQSLAELLISDQPGPILADEIGFEPGYSLETGPRRTPGC